MTHMSSDKIKIRSSCYIALLWYCFDWCVKNKCVVCVKSISGTLMWAILNSTSHTSFLVDFLSFSWSPDNSRHFPHNHKSQCNFGRRLLTRAFVEWNTTTNVLVLLLYVLYINLGEWMRENWILDQSPKPFFRLFMKTIQTGENKLQGHSINSSF